MAALFKKLGKDWKNRAILIPSSSHTVDKQKFGILFRRYLQSEKFINHIFFKKWAIRGLFFFIFVFSVQLKVNVQYKFLLMPGFELRTSGIGIDRSTN